MEPASYVSIDLWLIDIGSLIAVDDCSRLLSSAERERADKFHFAADRRRYIASHAALREILASYCARPPKELVFRRGAKGKPYLEDVGEISFNLSHSHKMAAVAVCASVADIGVDIEYIDAELQWRGLADLIFAENELETVLRVPEPRRRQVFFDIWTRKEAVSKARGSGFLIDFKSFCTVNGPVVIFPASRPQETLESHSCSERWQVHPLAAAEGYACALACREADISIRLRRFQPHSQVQA